MENLTSDNPSLPPTILKICKKCGEEFPLASFRNCNKNKDKKFSYCLGCQNTAERIRYLEKKEKRKTQIREWQEKNRGKMKRYQENWKLSIKRAASEISPPNSQF